MEIDIIDLTDPAYQDLTEVQLSMVRAAQTKKNAIVAECEAEKRKIFYFMLANNTALSNIRTFEEERLEASADAEIAGVREDLIQQLHFESIASVGNDAGPYRYPENPNYELSASQRFLVVRNYYMNVTSDAATRLQMYTMDTLARAYLGEYYQTLYELLAQYVK